MRNPFTASLNVRRRPRRSTFRRQVEPWTTSDLESVVWADVLGVSNPDTLPTTRAVAMAVPAVARARHLTAGTIAKLPLEAFRGADPGRPASPTGVRAPTGSSATSRPRAAGAAGVHAAIAVVADAVDRRRPPVPRTVRVADHPHGTRRTTDRPGWSGSRTPHGISTTTGRSPTGTGTRSTPPRLVVIPGPHEGILNFAAATIRTAARPRDGPPPTSPATRSASSCTRPPTSP